MKPSIDITDDKIVIRFYDDSYVILLENDMLLFNGKRIITTHTERLYSREFIKRHNLNKKHKRLVSQFKGNQVFIIDIGYDGRLFMLCFTNKKYNEYRGQPMWKASYWHDRRNKEKKFYVTDMQIPVRTWERQLYKVYYLIYY